MDRESDTEQSSRLLVLWLDLREAMEAAKRAIPVITEMTPWNCDAERVRAVWASLTRPENEHALREWLLMVGPGRMRRGRMRRSGNVSVARGGGEPTRSDRVRSRG